MKRVDAARIDRLVRAYALLDTSPRRGDQKEQRLHAAIEAVRAQLSEAEAAAYWRALQIYLRERHHAR